MRRELFPVIAISLSASAAFAGPHDELIAKHAAVNGVPEQLIRRVIRIESRGNAVAMHGGNYGLMQIRLATARGVGYAGDAEGLLDPDVNLTYAVKYLAGAYRAAGCNESRAVSYYQRGYYGITPLACGAVLSPMMQIAEAVKRKSAADVIKPKVVRIETIGPAKIGPAQPFEPVRVVPVPAVMELASVPLPPVRREPDVVAPKHRMRAVEEKKVRVARETKDGDLIGVVTFIKKLVTPDKSPHKRPPVEEADADPLPRVQAPQ